MGNACTIHNTTKSSPAPSQVYPPIPEFLQEIYSQYKIDCFSQVKSQSVHASALMPLPTINAARSYKKPLYVVNKRSLSKAIQEQASPGPSPSKRMASKSALQFMKLSGNVNPLSKEKWSKESSFVRQNPPSFHTSVSEIYDDGYMEYSRDSESLKVEDLWQDVSRTANSELQKGLSERLAQHNLDDRRRSDSYLTAVQEVFAGKIINVEDYRRGSVEGPLQNNPSPQKRNLKKEEVKMFQFRVEKEESNVKIPTFGRAESPERVKENLEKQPDNSNILNNDAQGIEIQQKMPSQKEKEMRMAKSLTTVAQSFSPIRRSQNASPDDNPFREEKSLYNETISPFEISPMKIDNSNSASKLPQSGFKPLVKYCSVGSLEPAQATGLYDGIQGVSQIKQSNFKGTPAVADVEKMYASVQLYPTENHMDNTDRSKRDFGPRKSSLMDRLMESLLEDRIRREEPKAILEAIEKESPSPSVKGNAFEKEKSSYEPSKTEYNSRQRLDYTADQSEISRSIAYKQPTPAQDNNVRFLEKTKNVTNINANVSTKNTYTSKPASHQSTEPDTSLVLKPPSAPSDCKSTQEFLETENECIQNPKEVWKRPISETSNQKPSKNLSYSSEPKSSHKHLMPFPAKELEPYQSVEPRPRRVTEVLSSSKSYLGHDLSIANYSSVMTSSKDLSSQLYPEKKESSSTTTTTTGIHNVIKKLAQPKNLSTYATPQVQQQKPAYRYATVDPTSIPPNPKSVKQQDMGVRRQSTGGERPENKKPNSYKDMTMKSRVSSVEKIKPAPVQDKYASLAKNDSQSQLKHNSSNKRLSVGSSSVAVKEYSMSFQDQRDKSPAPKKPVEIEKKQKVDKVTVTPENNENVPEESLNTIMNDSKFENDQAEMLYEEITKLDQKLAVTKSTGKMPLVEESMEKSPIKKPRVSESSAERGNKKGSYIQQAVKKSERHLTPLMGRVNRQSHNQSTEIQERRQTISNLSVQQEQIDSHITTEALGEDAKKGGKYNYNQALQMRIKFAEEVARRQSVADSTEWILNAKLPLYAGKIQDKAKKNQGC